MCHCKEAMFSYCKRSGNQNFAEVPYQYHMNPMQTTQGFGRRPLFCGNLAQPFVHNRGVPMNLLEVEAQLKGQDRSMQPNCGDQNDERTLQYSPFRWLQDTPTPTKGPVPCAPTPMIEYKTYTGSMCNHSTGLTPCGQRCGCSPRCQCKEMFRDRNVSRPYVGQLGISAVPGCKF